MSFYQLPPFDAVIDIALRQKEHDIARCVRETHEYLLAAAMAEADPDALATGVYRLRYYVAEGAHLHQWMAMLNRTVAKTSLPIVAIQREVSLGWLLFLNDQPDSAAFCFALAQQLMDTETPSSMRSGPQFLQAELDIAVGQFFLRADECPTPDDVQDAVDFWQHNSRLCPPDMEKRLVLALAALKSARGMVPNSHANAYDAYYYFAARGLNAEAGLAAYYLARCYDFDEDLDPLFSPSREEAERWLRTAAHHWFAIHLPLGLRLIEPYLEPIGLQSPPPVTSPFKRIVTPSLYTLN